MTDDTKIKRATKFLEMANEDHPSTKDVGAVFRAVIEHVGKFKESVRTELKGHKERIDNHIRETARMIGDRASRSELAQLSKRMNQSVAAISTRIETLPEQADLQPLHDRLTTLENKPEPTIPEETGESMRDKIEALEGDDRLHVSAIGGMDELKEELKDIAVKSGNGAIIAQTRGAVRSYDLTSKLNGSKTTFQLPAFGVILLVLSTSTPLIFQPLVDYTVDGKAMTLTFTNTVNPATTLASGQTLLVLYAEN